MPRPEHRWTFEAIGTHWTLESDTAFSDDVRTDVLDVCERFDAAWSRFRADSVVSGLGRDGGEATMPAESSRLAALYRDLERVTQGAMTPLVGVPLSRLGYDAGYRLHPDGPPVAAARWDDALHWQGRALRLARGEILDIGAAGKGELVDQVTDVLLSAGHRRFCVDGSGDLRVVGHREQPLRIALAKPGDAGLAVGVAELAYGALCASATDRRRWSEGLHHVLDGRTGTPVTEVQASWVVAESAMIADAMATALFLSPAAPLRELAEFEYVRLFVNGQAETSAGFPGKVLA
ncbi:FAD:protein FMN transferase [Mycetocola reblochoni]|uniref:FAD:protein FMN transferase n=2 Tax=Mycetocola reblochoni TaxID=331618 RepID=A0A1R4K9R3_9MICO|nr:FAD:protein FMN transferase [Mycetocola reblochoni]RLP71153.1 FAD:protein FMN transferase [Mycetocola reblochoni]SJN40914.1 Thiamin biosynthesis lipoprotein ApbE [Mycetocola reblochoni REB411]